MNFLEQILHFEGITSRNLHHFEKIKLTGDIERDIEELNRLIEHFEYYTRTFNNALLRLEMHRDDMETSEPSSIINKDYEEAIKWDKVNK